MVISRDGWYTDRIFNLTYSKHAFGVFVLSYRQQHQY